MICEIDMFERAIGKRDARDFAANYLKEWKRSRELVNSMKPFLIGGSVRTRHFHERTEMLV